MIISSDIDSESCFRDYRKQMISNQLIARGITQSNIVSAMLSVPRHLFVPKSLADFAYRDEPQQIGCAQTISQPYIVGLMTQLLKINSTDRILEIGTGSGYQTAILSLLAAEVYSIERIADLSHKADVLLNKFGYANVHLTTGDGYEGWNENAPFDKIIVTAAPPVVPEKLVEQLSDTGKMVIPVGNQTQDLLLIEKTDGNINITKHGKVRFVPML